MGQFGVGTGGLRSQNATASAAKLLAIQAITNTSHMPTSTGIFDVHSIAAGDSVAAIVCLLAAFLCFRCAKNPLYYSSAGRRSGDRRFWSVMTLGLIGAAILEFVGGYVVLWAVWRNLIRAVDAHPDAVVVVFYASMLVACICGVVVLRWAVVGSARRNWLALIGALIVAVAFLWRIYLMERQVFAAGAAEQVWFGAELHLIGVIVGALCIAAIAYHYTIEQKRQSHWRDNLTTSSQLIRHVGKRQQTKERDKGGYRPRLRLSSHE